MQLYGNTTYSEDSMNGNHLPGMSLHLQSYGAHHSDDIQRAPVIDSHPTMLLSQNMLPQRPEEEVARFSQTLGANSQQSRPPPPSRGWSGSGIVNILCEYFIFRRCNFETMA